MRSTKRPTGKFSTMITYNDGTPVPGGTLVSQTAREEESRANKFGKNSPPFQSIKPMASFLNKPFAAWALLLFAFVVQPILSDPAPSESGNLRASSPQDIQNAGKTIVEEGTVQILKTEFDTLMEKVDSILSGDQPHLSRRLSTSCPPDTAFKTESQLQEEYEKQYEGQPLVDGRPYKRHCETVQDKYFAPSQVYNAIKPYSGTNNCCVSVLIPHSFMSLLRTVLTVFCIDTFQVHPHTCKLANPRRFCDEHQIYDLR